MVKQLTWRIGLGVWLAASSSAPAWAQTPRWTFEIHGGLAGGSAPMQGTGQLPPAGPPLSPPSLVGGQVTDSWYFGSGASYLNQWLRDLSPGAPQLVPLDPMLTGSATRRSAGAVFGFRVSRRLTKHIEAEFNMDWDWGTAALSSATLAALQASQASFAPVWRQVLSDANPLSNFSVVDHRGQQIFTTGVAKIDLTTGRIRPFLTAGAGAVTSTGGDLSAVVTGHYQSSFLGPHSEFDNVTVAFRRGTVGVGVLGGGVTAALSARSGLRFEARAYIGANENRTFVSTMPVVLQTTPGSVFSLSNGSNDGLALTFSSRADVPSSLSDSLSNFQTFTGTGLHVQGMVTIGYFVRF